MGITHTLGMIPQPVQSTATLRCCRAVGSAVPNVNRMGAARVVWISLALTVSSVSCISYPTIRIIRNSTDTVPPAILPCWEVETKAEVLLWITHNGTIISSLDNSDNSDKYQISEQGALIVLDGVKDDSGTYTCITNSGEQLSSTDTKLEVVDTTFIPEIDDIMTNIIRSAIAGGSMAIFFLASCGLYHYRWTPDEERDEHMAHPRSSISSRSSRVSRASLRVKDIDTSSQSAMASTVLVREDDRGSRKSSRSSAVGKSKNGSIRSTGIDNQTFDIQENE